MMKEAQCTHETCGSRKEKISQDYEDFNVSTFSILGIWSLGGFHMFGIIRCEGSKPCSNWAFF
jgi:hypothetical protein